MSKYKANYDFPSVPRGKMVLFAGQEALSSHFMRKLKGELAQTGREVVDLSELSSPLELREALGESLFSSSKLVVLKDLQEVKFDYLKILEGFLKSDSDIILLATADSRFARTKAFKALEKAGCKTAFYPQPDYLSREDMVKKLFAIEGGSIEPAAAAFLAQSVEDASLLVGFCLQLLSECPGAVSKGDVFALTGLSPRPTAFDAAKKALAGDRSALSDLRKVLLEGEAPIAVIGALDYKFREQCLKAEGTLSPRDWAASFSLLSRANLALTSSSPQAGIDLIYEALRTVCEGARWKK
ncbi:MAG: hypothetical protein IKT06_01750 [Aeriscardovia sp.]|nr:hypothetical protein [Aeriscardovia sp.]